MDADMDMGKGILGIENPLTTKCTKIQYFSY